MVSEHLGRPLAVRHLDDAAATAAAFAFPLASVSALAISLGRPAHRGTGREAAVAVLYVELLQEGLMLRKQDIPPGLKLLEHDQSIGLGSRAAPIIRDQRAHFGFHLVVSEAYRLTTLMPAPVPVAAAVLVVLLVVVVMLRFDMSPLSVEQDKLVGVGRRRGGRRRGGGGGRRGGPL